MGDICEKATELMRAGFPLGTQRSIIEELPNGGRYQEYENATIFQSPQKGAFAVHDPILTRYRELGGPEGSLGYPLTDPTITSDGRALRVLFEGGSLYFDSAYKDLGVYLVPPTPVPCALEATQHGRWETAPFGSGVVGVHSALLPNNHVLFFTYKVQSECIKHPVPFGASSVLNVNTGHRSTPAYYGRQAQMENLFCAGHAFLEDGSLMVAGGEREDGVKRPAGSEAVRAIHIFSPEDGTCRHDSDCAHGRWYCSCVTLPDGRVLIVGGSVQVTYKGVSNTTFEIYDPASNSVSPETLIPDAAFAGWSSFPFLFVLPGNKVLVHFGTTTRFLDLETNQFLDLALEAAPRPGRQGRTYGVQGSAVMLPLQPSSSPPYRPRVMMIGGGGRGSTAEPHSPAADTPATTTCEILDLGSRWREDDVRPDREIFWRGPKWRLPAPLRWKLVAPMAHPRIMPDAVLLPDGKVLVCNGSSQGKEGSAKDPVYDAEIYDPEADSWTEMCHASVPRLYHATALLLADGSVLTAGTDCAWNPSPYNQSELRVEIFRPPYFFAGPRPHIGEVPDRVSWGNEIKVASDDAAQIESAAMIRCGSVTHSFNPDQRYVGLPILGRDDGNVRLGVPSDRTVAPPGPYLVFLLNADRIPSLGRYMLLRERRRVAVNVPELELVPELVRPGPGPDPLAELRRRLDMVIAYTDLLKSPIHGAHGTEGHNHADVESPTHSEDADPPDPHTDHTHSHNAHSDDSEHPRPEHPH